MPLNERDVVATVAEVRAAGPITPRALRRAVAARLGLDAKDEAVLFEKYAGRLKDAAAASNDAAAGEDFQYRRRRPPAPGRLERGRRRVPRALGAHGGPVFPWLVVDDRPAS